MNNLHFSFQIIGWISFSILMKVRLKLNVLWDLCRNEPAFSSKNVASTCYLLKRVRAKVLKKQISDEVLWCETKYAFTWFARAYNIKTTADNVQYLESLISFSVLTWKRGSDALFLINFNLPTSFRGPSSRTTPRRFVYKACNIKNSLLVYTRVCGKNKYQKNILW